jgi:ribokinase
VVDLSAEAAAGALATASVLMLQLEIPLEVVLAAAAAGRRAGALVMLNLAPARRLEPSQLADVGLLLVNEHEAVIQLGAVAEGKTPEEWAVALCRFVPCAVVTLGADGAVWACRAEPPNGEGGGETAWFEQGASPSEGSLSGAVLHGRAPAFKVNVVDTTAAGDAFAGALARYLAHAGSTLGHAGRPSGPAGTGMSGAGDDPGFVTAGTSDGTLAAAVRFASAAGALATTRQGAQPSLPVLAEVAAMLRAEP